MAFLFLDETSYEPLDLAALTGILVFPGDYAAIRDKFCGLVLHVQASPANVIEDPSELHARDLLPGDDSDQSRLLIFREIVAIVNAFGTRVFRCAYLNRNEIANQTAFGQNLYGLTFSSMLHMLQPVMANTLVVPVMDGIPDSTKAPKPPAIDRQLIRAFAQHVRSHHHYRQIPNFADSLTLENAHNLGEPLFADSTHSVFIQLVDLVSHLLLQLDREELKPDEPLSPYRLAVIAYAKQIRRELLHCERGKVQFG